MGSGRAAHLGRGKKLGGWEEGENFWQMGGGGELEAEAMFR